MKAVLVLAVFLLAGCSYPNEAESCLKDGGHVEYLGHESHTSLCGKAPCTHQEYHYACKYPDGRATTWLGSNPDS